MANPLSKTACALSPWFYQGQPVHQKTDLPGHELLYGYVYLIRDKLTGKLYVGQKSFGRATKKKATIKEKAAALALNARSHIKIVRGRKESDWLIYWGSNLQLQADVAEHGGARFTREIIDLACSKKYLGFSELEQMLKHNVLRRTEAYNDNILGKFFRRDLLNCPEEDLTI